MGVQISAAVQRVVKSMQAGAIARVLRGGRHREHVLFLQAGQSNAAAIECARVDRFAVHLDSLDRWTDEFYECLCAGLQAAKRDGGIGGECLVAVGEVELDLVAWLGYARGAPQGLLAR